MNTPDQQQIDRGVELIQTHNEQEEKAKEDEKERHNEVMENLEQNFTESREEVARTHLGFEQMEELCEDIRRSFMRYQEEGATLDNLNEAFQEHVLEHLESGGHPKSLGQRDRTFSIRDDGIHRYRKTSRSMLEPHRFEDGDLRVHLKQALEQEDAWETAEELITAHAALESHSRVNVLHRFDEPFEVGGQGGWVEIVAEVKEQWNGDITLEVVIKTQHYTRSTFSVPGDLHGEGLDLYSSQTEELFMLLESLLEKTEAIREEAEEAVEDIGVEL